MSMLSALQVYLRALFAPVSRRSAVAARGVTFIEYALLAAVAVGIGILFRKQLGSAFNTLLSDVKNALSSGASQNNGN